MLLQQIRLIGKHVVGSRDRLTTVLNSQGEYNSPFILAIVADLDAGGFEISYEEYDKAKESRYLRGTAPGNKPSYSPSLNFQLSAFTKALNKKREETPLGTDPFLDLLFSSASLPHSDLESYLASENGHWLVELLQKTFKFEAKILKIASKRAFSQLPSSSIVVRLFEFIRENLSQIMIETFLFLRNNVFEYDEKKQGFSIDKKKTASTLIFKIVSDSSSKYLGEYPGFPDLYLALVEEEKPKSQSTEMTCYTCGNAILSPNYPNIGFFTIDQIGFSLGFEKKGKASHLVVCDDCNQDIMKGFEIVNTDLKFWAYKTSKGVYGSDGQYIYHYVIPLIDSSKGLKEAVKQIARIKREFGTKTKESLQERISSLESMLQKAERKRKQAIKKEIKDLKKKIQRGEEELGERADLLQLLKQLTLAPMNFLDLYFYVSDAKQNPSTKEVVGFYVVDKSRIVFLRDVLAKLPANFSFRDLHFILGEKLFRRALGSLFEGKPFSEETFYKQFNSSLQAAFKERLYNIQRAGEDYSLSFERLIQLFKDSFKLFNTMESFERLQDNPPRPSAIDVSTR